ncbi:MAG: helix-turn-helix domain-containing protein [Gammaproteobacteria bacterium]
MEIRMGDGLSEECRIKKCQILWFDFRYTKNEPCVDDELTDAYDIQIISGGDVIDQEIERHEPVLICFDFDLPDQVGLDVLRKTKARYPSIPFVMITDDHSTELAIWALRARVWNYFVKPVAAEEIAVDFDVLLARLSENRKANRRNYMPQPEVPSEARPYRSMANSVSTICAVDFVRQNLSSKIAVENVARRCGMSKSHFSRTFKKEHDITFQNFLIQQRMNKAVKLLKNSNLHVTQIALSVGYCELSNFTSTFQRTIGIGPSNFRKALMPNHIKSQVYN